VVLRVGDHRVNQKEICLMGNGEGNPKSVIRTLKLKKRKPCGVGKNQVSKRGY